VVIIGVLLRLAAIVSWAAVLVGVFAGKLQRARMLDEPTLAGSIDQLIAEDADAVVILPDLERAARRHLSPLGGAEINEGHGLPSAPSPFSAG
jgi:hypothetical protein